MEILIVTHYYKHKNAMASIRPIKLAKYFSQQGHRVTVLTSLQKDNWCKQELNPIPSKNIREIYAPEYKGMYFLRKLYAFMERRRHIKKEKSENNFSTLNTKSEVNSFCESQIILFKKYLSWFYYYSCDRFENWCLYKGLKNIVISENLRGFDYVIATYPGAGIHKTGEWIKKSHRAKQFVADYRDPAYNPGGRTMKAEIRHDKKVQDDAVYMADLIVCVSNGMAEALSKQYDKEAIAPIYVVRNGFDPADNEIVVDTGIDEQFFNFVYTGALYNGRRTVAMLAKVLKELVDEAIIDVSKIKIHYAGSDYQVLLSQLKPYNLQSIAVDHGYVTRQQSLSMQIAADVVLLLNWNQDNYTGVIPGKIYEYMSSGSIIIALIMGNQRDSETAEMIRKDHLGCACEQAVSTDLEDLKSYIKCMYINYVNGCRPSLDTEVVSKYKYEKIAQEYIRLLNKHLI